MHCLLVHRVRQSADEMELYHRVRTFRLTELISASYTVIQLCQHVHTRRSIIQTPEIELHFLLFLVYACVLYKRRGIIAQGLTCIKWLLFVLTLYLIPKRKRANTWICDKTVVSKQTKRFTSISRLKSSLFSSKSIDGKFGNISNHSHEIKYHIFCSQDNFGTSLNHLNQPIKSLEYLGSRQAKYLLRSFSHGDEKILSPIKGLISWLTSFRENMDVNIVIATASIREIVDKLSKGINVPIEEQMKYEMLRLRSFQRYPNESKPFAIRFAQAGFYYSGNGDEVICFVCKISVQNWKADDDPSQIHLNRSPSCTFFTNKSAVNIPIRSEDQAEDVANGAEAAFFDSVPQPAKRNSNDHLSAHLRKHTVSEATLSAGKENKSNLVVNMLAASTERGDKERGSKYHNNSSSEIAVGNVSRKGVTQQQSCFTSTGNQLTQRDINRSQETTSHQIRPHVPRENTFHNGLTASNGNVSPKYPKYSTQGARFNSFQDCSSIAVSRLLLSIAGFFFAGIGDCTRCFFCGIGLRHWCEGDDPWTEHARFSKDCQFLLQIKGHAFVDAVNSTINSLDQQENLSELASLLSSIGGLLPLQDATRFIEMGFSNNTVVRAIEAIVSLTGRDSVTSEAVLEQILTASETVLREEAHEHIEHQTENLGPESPPSIANRAALEPSSRQITRLSLDALPAVVSTVSSESSNTEKTNRKYTDTRQQKRNLLEENETLKLMTFCIDCKINEVCIVFLPCGHLITCESCSQKQKYCKICGEFVKGTVRTYRA